jgi:hypothetical protein
VIAQQPSDTGHQATGEVSRDTEGDAAGAYQGVSGNGDRPDRIVDGDKFGDQDKVYRVRLWLGIIKVSLQSGSHQSGVFARCRRMLGMRRYKCDASLI